MGYSPSVRSRWLDIGQVLFLRVFELAKKKVSSPLARVRLFGHLFATLNFLLHALIFENTEQYIDYMSSMLRDVS